MYIYSIYILYSKIKTRSQHFKKKKKKKLYTKNNKKKLSTILLMVYPSRFYIYQIWICVIDKNGLKISICVSNQNNIIFSSNY